MLCGRTLIAAGVGRHRGERHDVQGVPGHPHHHGHGQLGVRLLAFDGPASELADRIRTIDIRRPAAAAELLPTTSSSGWEIARSPGFTHERHPTQRFIESYG